MEKSDCFALPYNQNNTNEVRKDRYYVKCKQMKHS